jgi:hypothetical protein
MCPCGHPKRWPPPKVAPIHPSIVARGSNASSPSGNPVKPVLEAAGVVMGLRSLGYILFG